jgi:hypothetical protein
MIMDKRSDFSWVWTFAPDGQDGWDSDLRPRPRAFLGQHQGVPFDARQIARAPGWPAWTLGHHRGVGFRIGDLPKPGKVPRRLLQYRGVAFWG